VVGAPGTPSAWETAPPARSPRRLTITGDFRVDGGHHHQLDEQARRLGFADLRGCLQALLDEGWSVPQLAVHLDTTQPAIRRAITDHHLHQPPHQERLARQRQRAAQQRAAARAAELGFGSVRAYLVDRLVTRAWTLEEVMGELGTARGTLRRLLDHHQVRRVAPTRRQRAAATTARGPTTQPRVVERRRRARLVELGFAEVDDYLRDRYVRRGWSVRRLGAELGAGHGWVDKQLRRLGLRA
jgi:hypothetical protein